MDRGNFGQRLQHFPKILPGYSLAERLPVSFNWTKRTQQVQFMETKIRHPYLLLTYSHRANEDSSGTLTGTKIVFPVVCCFIRLGACFRTRRNFYLLLYSERKGNEKEFMSALQKDISFCTNLWHTRFDLKYRKDQRKEMSFPESGVI